MSEPQRTEPSGEWRRVTFDTVVEVTDRVALAAASFDRVIDPDTGEESMMDFPYPDQQLQSYLSRVFQEALRATGESVGFRWRSYSNIQIAAPDETGNFRANWLPPQPGPNGIPMHEAYPEVFPDED